MKPSGKARTPIQRIRRRIHARFEELQRIKPGGERKTPARLAKLLGISKGSMSGMLNGSEATQGLLAHLDHIADYLGVPPSWLVQREDAMLSELRGDEHKLLAHWRRLPNETHAQILEVFDMFAGLLPEEREARRWWAKIRRIKKSEHVADLERTLDDILRAQRTRRDEGVAHAAPPSGGATRRANAPRMRFGQDKR